MALRIAARIALDYAGAAQPLLLRNLSGVATSGQFVWTVSDEGRTVECLAPSQGGYRLHRQFELDHHIDGIPGLNAQDELDLEGIDVADGSLWLCGSHCRVRKKPDSEDHLNAMMRDRPSRCLLAKLPLADGAAEFTAAGALPFKGPGSLRDHLQRNEYLQPFLHLPSKENGLDIEGFAWHGGLIFLGLRGPLLDSFAVVVALKLSKKMAIKTSSLCFLDLGGLGIRDLARDGDDLLVLAGPVSASAGPFRIFRWKPQFTDVIQKPALLFEWPSGDEKPEGICVTEQGGQQVLLTVYDSPDDTRLAGSTYFADVMTMN
jgi:hypothetical protein